MTGRQLNDQEISGVVAPLFWVAMETTSMALSNVICDLANHPEHWATARKEVLKHVGNPDPAKQDWTGLMANRFITAVVMETARLTSQVFGMMRKPEAG